MNRLVEWIEHRSGVFGAVKRSMDRAIPSRSRWGGIWPSMIGFTFAVQVITGIAMWMYYSPSAQTAWESVYYLEYQVAGGWLLRALHHYVAQVMVALLGLYVVWMIVVGGYRKPREMVFWAAIVTGLVGLALLLTGDLLSWGQNSFWATQVRVKFLTLVPLLGNDLFKLAAGGPSFGHHTLTRFFALHAGVFSGIFLALLLV
ncbi:MAG: menaquinol-cytochrome C reductase, partial [Rhodopirellula sp.]|nr:menaquinol-cytochrome C reductase [Rhodopirellula sp.]